MFKNTKFNKIVMFKNTNLLIKTVFENTNCLLPSKQHDRLNNRQSGHGHSHKSYQIITFQDFS